MTKLRRHRVRSLLGALVAVLAMLSVVQPAAHAVAGAQTGFPAPSWTDKVGSIAFSSPASGVIDGQPVIAFGTETGYLYVVNARTGANLRGWPQPVDIGGTGPTAVESSPTIADLDGPHKPPTIIVGAGSTYVRDQQGGLIAFNADGTVRFVFHTQDVFNEWSGAATGGKPDGYDEAVFSTPAIGDVTGDGQQDIVFGSYDHRIYALDPSGQLVPGFPLDQLDTVWSSPALFHVRGLPDQEDIFIGGDASGRDGCFGGFISDYTYRDGRLHEVWQHCKNQTIWSSPSIGVINATGRPAVVVGTGFGEVPPYKSDAFKLFAYYADNGARVAGWPVATAGPAVGSPAIGTLPGSSLPSVVDTSWCADCHTAESMVYAWTGDGQQLWSETLPGAQDLSSPVLVDLTGSGINDVIVGSDDGLFSLDGADGSFLFGESASDPINTCSEISTPLVEQLPGRGANSGWRLFETCGGPLQVTGNGTLFDYPLPTAPAVEPPWAGWRDGPAHDGVATATLGLAVSSSTG